MKVRIVEVNIAPATEGLAGSTPSGFRHDIQYRLRVEPEPSKLWIDAFARSGSAAIPPAQFSVHRDWITFQCSLHERDKYIACLDLYRLFADWESDAKERQLPAKTEVGPQQLFDDAFRRYAEDNTPPPED